MKKEIEFDGLEDFAKDLKKAVNAYPDMAEKTLALAGKKLKATSINNTKSRVNVNEENQKGIIKGYSVSPTMGRRENMYKEFYAKAKHFHLLEHGHNVVSKKNGEIIRFKEGYHMVEDAIKDVGEEMPELTREMVDAIFKRCKL